MKKLLLLIAVTFSPIAHADKWMEAENKIGGKIVLLSASCPIMGGWKLALATNPGKKTETGCWYYGAGEVHVRYDDGEMYSYPPKYFTLIDTEVKK